MKSKNKKIIERCCVTGCHSKVTNHLGNNLIDGWISFCENHMAQFEKHSIARENMFYEQGKINILKELRRIYDKLDKNGHTCEDKWLKIENWIFNQEEELK